MSIKEFEDHAEEIFESNLSWNKNIKGNFVIRDFYMKSMNSTIVSSYPLLIWKVKSYLNYVYQLYQRIVLSILLK